MTTTTLTTAKTTALMSVLFVAMLGAATVFLTGFAQSQTLHEPHMTCAMPLVSPATNPMIQRMLTSAVLAGFAAGLLAGLLHFAFVQDLILLGEQYETGARVHFAAAEAGHRHDHADAALPEPSAAETTDHHAQATPASDLSRNLWTSLMFGMSYAGYAMLLVAGFALAEIFGHALTPSQGLLWGIAGFAAFQLAPAMGMAPELPGTMAADLNLRQIWWAGTAFCTALGLGLLSYGKGIAALGAGALILTVPHLIGAPALENYSGVAPPELASALLRARWGTALVVWAVMGGACGAALVGQMIPTRALQVARVSPQMDQINGPNLEALCLT